MYDQGLVIEEEWLALGEEIQAHLDQELRTARVGGGQYPMRLRDLARNDQRLARKEQSLREVIERNEQTRRRIAEAQ